MYLTKWDPFETLTSLHDDIDRIFNCKISTTPNRDSLMNTWFPAVDIHEDNEAFNFDVEAPGVSKDDLDIKIENNVLMIKGERKGVSEEKKKNYYRIERNYGCFNRSFSLPETADSEKITAEYKNGVLQIKIAKKEAAKPRNIKVTVS